ncbi:prepilin-type N-terminal cleavage/methylation domain-containing protein [Coleofasciculus sp. FACHB-712]|uniref:prepilin-type N-terminal cleavage/methylation domain-containing protein n=1 Tax=Coleofasciculus sp. FACHB-712 TaxID=2692789 RepID=UPI00168377C8|nr:prepilin-type N-terminal cleavage/methylation domain-containing protein [Coleofasciculus sp. FACHB-712]MBD1942961.1 prepilin-type N-terminal cleavage/methylation domain-containing protein [Coleofasciculus sp. FACHB-712]
MRSFVIPKILQRLPLVEAAKKDRRKDKPTASNSGFTMIELLVVIIIVGILSAITAPGWLAFVNRQRMNTVNDSVLRGLQEAQREAKRTKRSYSVSFKTLPNQLPKFAVYPAGTTPLTASSPPADNDPRWKTLAENQDIKPGQIQVIASTTSFTFDYQGRVSELNNLPAPEPDPLFKVTVSVANSPSVKRCVKVKTLVGTIQTGKNVSECSQ